MPSAPYVAVLRGVGAALLALTLLSLGVTLYNVANGAAYRFSMPAFLNIIASVFLLRGSLRAAAVVRWVAFLCLGILLGMLFTSPFTRPLSLSLTMYRLHPADVAVWVGMLLFYGAFVFWVIWELGRAEVLNAQAAAGQKRWSMKLPAALGAVLVGLPFLTTIGSQHGELDERAKSLAAKQVGPDYRLYVDRLEGGKSEHGYTYRATVTAWTEIEVRQVSVQWEDL